MLNHPTYDKLTRLKLFGMARAFAEQSALDLDHLGFEERLSLPIGRAFKVRHLATKSSIFSMIFDRMCLPLQILRVGATLLFLVANRQI
jgi:hypothetical protein